MKYILYLSISLILFSSKSLAQDPYAKEFVQNIIPPSPSAFQMSTYGNLPFNGSSGGFSYGVPLYTINCGDISLPLSINYHSSGVQVDELAGVTGINWSLNAGGTISRVVKDFPDEIGTRWYPESPDTSDPADEVMLRNLARESSFDGEQDWFSFNVNGLSGSFFFDEDLQIHVLSESNVKITYELSSTTPARFTFTLTDDKGYKYIFGGSNSYIEKNTPLPGCSSENYTYDSAWYLKEIISPKNNTITFNYTDNIFTYKTSYNSSVTFTSPCPDPSNMGSMTNQSVSTCLNSTSMESKVISSIIFKNNSVIFEYNTTRLDGGGNSLKQIKVQAGTQLIKDIYLTYYTYGPTTTPTNPFLGDPALYYRTFLKDITIKGNLQSTEQQKYSFEYYSPELLPVRLSYNKDKYGFHNNSNNTTAFSSSINTIPGNYLPSGYATANTEVNPVTVYYGMISKIIYPTKGYSNIIYEGNSDTKIVQTTAPPEVFSFAINKTYCNGTPLSQSKTWISDGTPIKINGNTSSNGNFGCSTGSYTIEVKKDNVVVVSVTFPYGQAYNTNNNSCTSSFNNYAPICTVAGSTYIVTITLSGGTAFGQFTLDYLQPQTLNTEQVYYGPGARVKTIIDTSEGKAYNKRLFYYNKLADYQLANTTLQHFYEPIFYSPVSHYFTSCQIPAPGWTPGQPGSGYLDEPHFDAVKFSITSASSYQLSRQGVNYSTITEVIEKDGNKYGAIERTFVPNPLSPGQTISGHDIFNAPPSNYGDFFRDKIKEETIYDKQDNPKAKKVYDYMLLYNDFIPSWVVRRNYVVPGEDDWGLSENMYSDIIWYFSNFSIWYYKNYYGVIKLITVTESEYFSGGAMESVTTMSYGGQPYYQLQSESAINSLGETIQTQYKYSNDLIGIEQTPYMQQLTDAHRIAEPVVIKSFKAGNKLSEKHLKYDNSSNTGSLLLPIEVFTRKGTGDINVTVTTDRKLQITKYDINGNILEYKIDGDIPVSIIWGYNSQYPIAKIENATYSQVSSYVSGLQTASNNGTLTSASFTTMRNALTNAIVTTYTYKPLLGIATATDAKGDTTTFTYDNNGSLWYVSDKHNKIISESLYHFKP